MTIGFSALRARCVPLPGARRRRRSNSSRPGKSATKRRPRPAIDLRGRPDLFDLAGVHHGDLVGHRQRLFLIVGDEQERDADAALQVSQLGADLLAELRIERGERFVEQETSGCSTMARARATRWRSPPESSDGLRDAFAFQADLFSTWRTRSVGSVRLFAPQAEFDVALTVRCGNSA